MTPIQSFYALKGMNQPNNFLKRLEDATLGYLKEFIESNPSIDSASTYSDGFFFYQQTRYVEYKKCLVEQGRSDCPHYLPPTMRELVSIFTYYMKRFLNEAMITEGPIHDLLNNSTMLNRSLFIWTSIHSNGSSHDAHHHYKSALSGAFYVTTPENSGSIVFYDPRGSLPPFGKTLRIIPSPGKLVIFPSWVVHNVQPTLSKLPRISISFNLDGEWETTSDVNTAFFSEQ